MAAKKTKLIKIEKEFNLIGNHVAIGDEVEINYKDLRIKQFSYRGKKLYSTSEFNFTKGVPINLEGFEPVTFEDASNLIIESQI
jgi:hypothetical protein